MAMAMAMAMALAMAMAMAMAKISNENTIPTNSRQRSPRPALLQRNGSLPLDSFGNRN